MTHNYFNNYLKKIATIVIFIFALLAVQQNLSAKSKNKKIGIQLYSVMAAVNENPKASIERLAKMGYNQVELVQWGGSKQVFGLEPADFKAICDANNVDIISTHSSIQDDPAREEEILASWRQILAIQKVCGGEYFVIPSYKVDYTEKDVLSMCDYFNRVGKLAKDEFGIKLGYHNHSGEYKKLKDSEKTMWEFLVENTDPEYVFFELDVYWCAKGGKDPVEYLKKYPDRIRLLHVKDVFVIGESGEIDFKNIFKQFYKNGMKDYVVEIEIPRSLSEETNADGSKLTQSQIMDRMFDAADKSAMYLKKAKFVK